MRAIWILPNLGNFLLFFENASKTVICKKTEAKLFVTAIIKASFNPSSQLKHTFRVPNVKTSEPNEPNKIVIDILYETKNIGAINERTNEVEKIMTKFF